MDISTQGILGKDDFLKLFTTQLRYQDPLNPMDSTEFTSQLAQFSSLEQLTNINEQMSNLVLFQNSLQNTPSPGMPQRLKSRYLIPAEKLFGKLILEHRQPEIRIMSGMEKIQMV
jgi:hypothetical protein